MRRGIFQQTFDLTVDGLKEIEAPVLRRLRGMDHAGVSQHGKTAIQWLAHSKIQKRILQNPFAFPFFQFSSQEIILLFQRIAGRSESFNVLKTKSPNIKT